jgi:hypothetical protein
MAKDEKGAAQEQVAEALVSGLVVRCNHCTQARVDLAAFEKQHLGVMIEGSEPDARDPNAAGRPGRRVAGPFKVVCNECNNTGMTLSEQGKRFMSIMRQHLPQLIQATEPRPERPARAS